MNLTDMGINTRTLMDLIAEGYITKWKHPDADLWIYNYTQKAQWSGLDSGIWGPETSQCRGLITTGTGEVVALPFAKFWNYGQQMPKTDLVEVTTKLDGQLGILYRTDVGYQVATRGTFTSPMALWASEYLDENFNLIGLPDWLTLLFEIIAPQFRVVVDYEKQEELFLIGARNMITGADYPWDKYRLLAEQFRMPCPFAWTWREPDEVIAKAKVLDANQEGWVMRFADGQRLKVKGDAYKTLARAIAGVSEKHTLEALISETYIAYLERLPDDLRSDVEGWAAKYIHEANIVAAEIVTAYAKTGPWGKSREERKVLVKEMQLLLPEDWRLALTYHDGGPLRKEIYKRALSQL